MDPGIDTLLLLALPASGKSEIRRYLGSLDAARAAALGLGPLTHHDDYPYVHLMRRISEESRSRGGPAALFPAPHLPFVDPRDWLTLIHLLNDDLAVAVGAVPPRGPLSAAAFLDRLDAARHRAGIDGPVVSDPLRAAVAAGITADVARLAAPAPRPDGGTILVEFARGGPEGAPLPLPRPHGYRHSLATLAPAALAAAAILYVAVDPAQSRRRNRERSAPGPDGDASILFHGVPEEVMRADYGSDDFAWLVDHATVPGTVTVEHPTAGTFHVPAVTFDNRDDRTSFLREDPATWPAEDLADLHDSLAAALDGLVPRT